MQYKKHEVAALAKRKFLLGREAAERRACLVRMQKDVDMLDVVCFCIVFPLAITI